MITVTATQTKKINQADITMTMDIASAMYLYYILHFSERRMENPMTRGLRSVLNGIHNTELTVIEDMPSGLEFIKFLNLFQKETGYLIPS
jgi:hypothetical protein